MGINGTHRDKSTRATRVRLWRWRRNPLRRGSDRAEAWSVLAAGVLLAVGAPAVGAVTATGVEDALLRQSQEWHRTSAVLIEDAPSVPDSAYAGSSDDRVRATVRWTTADGVTGHGDARVDPGSHAGTPTTVWLDDNGRVKAEPASPSQALIQGTILGSLAATGTGLLALGGLWTVRIRLDARRDRQWEREWDEIDPRWGSRRS
jgi:hypothetical protein